MKTAKVIYGTPTTQENFWSYAVDAAGKAVIVRHETLIEAVEEMQRMKNSDARKVGCTNRKIDELDMRKFIRSRGWKLEVIR